MVLIGYWLMVIPPGTEPKAVIDRAFNGMLAVIAGGILWLGGILINTLFKRKQP